MENLKEKDQKPKYSKNRKREQKRKLEKICVTVFMFIFLILSAGCVGYMLGTMEKKKGDFSVPSFILYLAIIYLILIVAFLIHIYMHELGHLVFGLLTGYRFQSIRFGSLMFIKQNGKIKIKKMKITGTGGQCLMLPPEGDEADYPTGWYNWGGCIVNLLITVICGTVLLLLPDKVTYAGLILLTFTLIGIYLSILNALPLASLGNDGANVIILRKNVNARKAFRVQLLMNNELANGKKLSEMPKEWFEFDMEKDPLDNSLVVSRAVIKLNTLITAKQFEEAEVIGKYILDNAENMATIYESMIKAELLFCEIMLRDDIEHARSIYQESKKQFKTLNSQPSMERIRYSYYILVEKNETEAKKQLLLFEQIIKKYPYPSEIEAERELIKAAEEKRNNS